MSGRKNVLLPYTLLDAVSMSDDLSSASTSIQYLDNVAIQLSWTGSNPVGTIDVQVSLDGSIWTDVSGASVTAAGSADSAYLDLNQLSAPQIRINFTADIENGSVTAVADSSGSLNNTYFLIDGANGTNWYVWFDNGGGVDPAITGRTGVHITYTNNATAATIGGKIRTALATVTSLANIAGSSAIATFDQSQAGSGSVVDGAVATGFAFSYTDIDGALTAVIGAKML